jgi:choice-of-anchor B domain-containing protein
LVLSAVLVFSIVGVVPSAAHPEGEDLQSDRHYPSEEARAHELANVVAANANEESNAPRGFAPCIRGMAADTFPCDGVDMMSHLTLGDLGVTFVSDIWGWTDPGTGADYAIVGGRQATVFVDISDPKRPDVVGLLPAHTNVAIGGLWKDIKVYDNHAFIVSESVGHGMQVFDLRQLRGVTRDPVTFEETAHYAGVSRTHNLNINTDTGYAYLVSGETCSRGLHMVDVSNPTEPAFAGCFTEHGNIHDTQCVIYEGPDTDYQGREICFNSAPQVTVFGPGGVYNTLSIVDVTDKERPQAIANVEYAQSGISHQGWLTPDQGYFLHGDEYDETFYGINTRTRIWDVRDLDDPRVIGAFDSETAATDHNIYTAGDRAYASNYSAGLRIYDTSDVANGELSEVGFFDVYPEHDNPAFRGTWSNYPWYEQGVVAVSSQDRGLFVLKPKGRVGH